MGQVSFKRVLFYIVIWLFALITIAPLVMMVVISFRVQGDVYKPIYEILKPTGANYSQVFHRQYFFNWYWNTIKTVLVTIVLRLIVTIPAAYSFSRIKFRGSRIVMAILLATLMIPGETTMVPRYLFFRQIHLLDSMWVIVLPEMTEVFYLMLLSQFFASIPEDFSEAAKIDGAGHTRILAKIFIPLSGPIIATTVLFSFINIWNNFLDPYLFISTPKNQMLTPAIQFFQARGGGNIPVQMAAASLAIIPIVILFVFTQKYFVAGVSSSGIKG